MRFFVGFLVTIGLIILVIVLLVRGGGGNATSGPKALNLETRNTASTMASYIIDAPVVAESQHREVKIDVSQDQVTFTQYQGYEQNPTNTQTFPNNAASYAVFLHALQHAGFTLGNTSNALKDERGYCPNGYRYIYAFQDGTKQLQRFWSTSCGTSQGTFKGTSGTIRTLFENQVPNYGQLSETLYNN